MHDCITCQYSIFCTDMATAGLTATQEWVKLESAELPEITVGHIVTYFVSVAVGFTTDRYPVETRVKDYKALDTQGHSLFKTNRIQSIVVSRKGSQFFLKCVCLAEVENGLVYNLDMTIDDYGYIESASCDCPPGDKVDNTCKHISALCYTLEENNRIEEMCQPSDYCGMSRLQECICPRKCHRLPQEVEESETTELEEYGQPMVYDPRPPEFRHTTAAEIEALRDALLATGKDILLLHVLPPKPG